MSAHVLCFYLCVLQGYLAHENPPPPQDPTVALCLGTYGDPRGTPVQRLRRGRQVTSPSSSFSAPPPMPGAFRARARQGSAAESTGRTQSQCTPRACPVEAYVHLRWKPCNLEPRAQWHTPWGQEQAIATRFRRHTHHFSGASLVRKGVAVFKLENTGRAFLCVS